MKNKKVIIIVVSIVVVLLIIMAVLFIAVPIFLNNSARKILQSTSNNLTGESLVEQMEEQAKEMFNQKFLVYETSEDETTSSANVRLLFSAVANNNDDPENRTVDVNGTVITASNLEDLKTLLNSDTQYKVKCIYDEEGYVKTIELRYL